MAESKKGFDLAAVLGEVSKMDTGRTDGREQIEYIPLESLVADPNNFYTLSGVDELARNIELVGLQQPIRVRLVQDNEYQVVSGHRRRAAIQMLVDEGHTELAEVPCIVESDDASPALRELRLIYANSDTRRMTSADISKQVERVEMLLYQLKEEGYEFPGKMRDHVAEACKISASKLARLKVIRENLEPEIKQAWEDGSINESIAYELAKLSPLDRIDIWSIRGKNNWGYSGAEGIRRKGERLQKVDSLVPPKKCPVGGEVCANSLNRRKASLSDSMYYSSPCEGCCSGCSELATCKQACPHLAAEIEAAKKARKEKKDAEKQEVANIERPIIEHVSALWRRFGEARANRGVTVEDWYKENHWLIGKGDVEQVTKRETGEGIKRDTMLPYGWSIRRDDVVCIVRAADLLGCSIDYLFCRTDVPEVNDGHGAQVIHAGAGWTLATTPPPKGSQVLADFDLGAGKIYRKECYFDGQDYLMGMDAKIDMPPIRWLLIPPVEDQANG